jgi:hypothetical protein
VSFWTAVYFVRDVPGLCQQLRIPVSRPQSSVWHGINTIDFTMFSSYAI